MKLKIVFCLTSFCFIITQTMGQQNHFKKPSTAIPDFCIEQNLFFKTTDLYKSNQFLAFNNYQPIHLINTKSFNYSNKQDSSAFTIAGTIVGSVIGFALGYAYNDYTNGTRPNGILVIKPPPLFGGVVGAGLGLGIGYLIGRSIDKRHVKKSHSDLK